MQIITESVKPASPMGGKHASGMFARANARRRGLAFIEAKHFYTNKKGEDTILSFLLALLFRCERKQRDVASTLYSERHLALMLCAVAGNAAWKYLAALRDEPSKLCDVFVVDAVDMVNAEAANLPAWTTTAVTSHHFSLPFQNGISSSETESPRPPAEPPGIGALCGAP